ncbi:site-2 protease family protein [bacterium]|nr:site-2 protease family protein [bacterium]
MATALGDPTPKYDGRLTLNPIKHLDWVGALALMLSLMLTGGRIVVGWGKPVRYSTEAMRSPITDGAIVALAGPLSNFFLALCAGLPVKFGLLASFPVIVSACTIFAGVNIALFIFNMIPFPPLDGWKIVQAIVPASVAYRMKDAENSWGMVPLYILMVAVYVFGSYTLGPIYRLFMEVLVGRMPMN